MASLPDLWDNDSLRDFEAKLFLDLEASGEDSRWSALTSLGSADHQATSELVQRYICELMGIEVADIDEMPDLPFDEISGNKLIKRYTALADFEGQSESDVENCLREMICTVAREIQMV